MSAAPLPGPPSPLFGLPLAKRFRTDPLGFLTETASRYGDIAFWRMGPVRACLVTHPDLVRAVLVSEWKKFPKQRRTIQLLSQADGDGLVLSDGPLWERQRRLVTPSFHPSRIARYVPMTESLTLSRIARWPGQDSIDMVTQMTELTLDIIAKTLFGVELGDDAARFGRAVHDISEAMFRELGQAVPLPEWLPLPSKRKKRRGIRALDSFVRQVIAERRASGADRGDVMSMLLLAVEQDGKGMTDELARDEAVTLLTAGHDTTAAGLTWVWYCLARHPDVQESVRAELAGELGERPVTAEDLPRLKLTERVVKEAMRLYPPAWMLFAREAAEDVTLGGHVVRKGTWVYLSPWATQRDPRFFDEPERFFPDRWAEGAKKTPPYAYFPFGGGPHVCIGSVFAVNEMKTIIATIIRRLDLELLPENVVPEPLLFLRPKGGLPFRCRRR